MRQREVRQESLDIYGDVQARKQKTALELMEINNTLTDQIRELSHFIGVAVRLKGKFGEITPEALDEYELEYWSTYLQHRVAVTWLTEGRPDKKAVEMALCMPVEVRSRLVDHLTSRDKCLSWFKVFELPEVKPLQFKLTQDQARSIALGSYNTEHDEEPAQAERTPVRGLLEDSTGRRSRVPVHGA
jgi:hypothetical protein